MSTNYPAGVIDKDFDVDDFTDWTPVEKELYHCETCDQSVICDEDGICEECFQPKRIEIDLDFYEEE